MKIDCHFLFNVNGHRHIALPMSCKLTFICLGMLLTHRQSIDTVNRIGSFMNVTSYGNKRLFTHMRQSFKRN